MAHNPYAMDISMKAVAGGIILAAGGTLAYFVFFEWIPALYRMLPLIL